MTQWTDKHYDFNYTLTEKDIEDGRIRVDAYFVAKVWKTGSKDDSGALWHCLKTIARFGDKNDVEREVKALHAQVLGVARSFGVELEPAKTVVFDESNESHTDTTLSLWYPDDSGKWYETSRVDFDLAKKVLQGTNIEVLTASERADRAYEKTVRPFEWWAVHETHWGNRVAYKVVK